MTEHRLADGTLVTLRPIHPDDRDGLREGFQRLSAESRHRRFFSGVDALTEKMVDYLVNVDGVDHVALVATVPSLDLKAERGVGVARFIRVAGEPDVAEVAVTVVDEMQRRGLGHLLVKELTGAARSLGVKKFRGEMLESNDAVRRLMEDEGVPLAASGHGTLVFDIPIDEPGAKASRLERLLRAAASSIAFFVRNLRPPAD